MFIYLTLTRFCLTRYFYTVQLLFISLINFRFTYTVKKYSCEFYGRQPHRKFPPFNHFLGLRRTAIHVNSYYFTVDHGMSALHPLWSFFRCQYFQVQSSEEDCRYKIYHNSKKGQIYGVLNHTSFSCLQRYVFQERLTLSEIDFIPF